MDMESEDIESTNETKEYLQMVAGPFNAGFRESFIKAENGKELVQIIPESMLFKLESDCPDTRVPEAAFKPESDERPSSEEKAELNALVDEEIDKKRYHDLEDNSIVGTGELDNDGEAFEATDFDSITEEAIWLKRAMRCSKNAIIKQMSAKISSLKIANKEKARKIHNLTKYKCDLKKAMQVRKIPKEGTVKSWVRDYIIKHRSLAWANFIIGSTSRKLTKNFTEQEILKAIGLRRISKKAYNYTRDNGLSPLPGKSTLEDWVKHNPQYGIPTIGEYVRPTVSKKRKHEDEFVDDDDANPCGRCGKNYSTQAKLNEHLSIVHGDESAKKFQCKVCDKWLAGKKEMVGHQNMHMDIKPFKCTFCERSYRNSGNMQAHRKEKHSEEWNAEKSKRGL